VTTYVGTKRVGRVPVVVLGPLDCDVLLQNQSPQQMSVWLTADVEADPIVVPPYQGTIAPVGSEGVLAAAPLARGSQAYTLFYSSLAVPDGMAYPG